MSSNNNFPFLVADIGGTNARYALITGRDEATGEYNITQVRVFVSADYDSFSSSLEAYFETLNGNRPKNVCIAIAGPIERDFVELTNLKWEFSISEIKIRYGFDTLLVMNDFAGLAYGVPHLPDANLLDIKPGPVDAKAAKVVIGPGTGLGVSALVHTDKGYIPVPGEGGHVAIAPGTDTELELFKVLREQQQHISAEDLICGRGLVNLYKGYAKLRQQPINDYVPSDVTKHALGQTDPLCVEAFNSFLGLLGSYCGDLALIFGARGGIYLGGGILPRVQAQIPDSQFLNRFMNKGPMRKLVKDIPVKLITHSYPAFIGAAAWLDDHLNAQKDTSKTKQSATPNAQGAK
ncbi:MAG: glucokinase [Phenylobacterium sp.]|jgi:glucokinase